MTDRTPPPEVVDRLWNSEREPPWVGHIEWTLSRLTPADLRALVAAMMEGHVIVPKEPTEVMLQASAMAIEGDPSCDWALREAEFSWRAMLEAAQAAPPAEPQGEDGDG